MKFYQKGSLAIAALAIAAGSAQAQNAEIYDQPVVLGLTISYNAPEVSNEIEANGVVTYTESGKVVTLRYSNREFLADMVTEGTIPSADGWSIVFRSDSDGDRRGFFLKKLGQEDISLNDQLELEQVSESISTYAYKLVDGGSEETATESTLLRMRLGTLQMKILGVDANAQGIVVETNSRWTANGTDPVGDKVPGLLTFQNFVGSYGDFDDDCDIDDDHGDEIEVEDSLATSGEEDNIGEEPGDDLNDDFDDDRINDDGLRHHGERNESWGLIQGVTKVSRGRLVLVQ